MKKIKLLSLLCSIFLWLGAGSIYAAPFTTITDVSGGAGNDYAQGLAIQGDGKFVVVGYSKNKNTSNTSLFVLRYGLAGSLDTSFGNAGVARLNIPESYYNKLRRLSIDASNDKLLVAGKVWNNVSKTYRVLIARLNTDGTTDTTFGTDGYVETEISGNIPKVWGLTMQNNGAFFVTLTNAALTTGQTSFAVLKYLKNGVLDNTFANNGILNSDMSSGQGDNPMALAIQSDGKLVVVGDSYGINGASKFKEAFIARYTANGSFDTSFAGVGYTKYRAGSFSNDTLMGVKIQNDGKIVVVGYSKISTELGQRMILMRYLSNGSLDTTFGNNGVIRACPNYPSSSCSGLGLQLQSDGKIVVAGNISTGATVYPIVYRYDTDGTLDLSFGTGGTIVEQSVSDMFKVAGLGLTAINDTVVLTGTGKANGSINQNVVLLKQN